MGALQLIENMSRQPQKNLKLQKLKKSKLSAHSQQDPIVINKHQQRTSRKKTRSKKLTNIVESTDETKSSETVLNTLDTIISETPSNTEQGNA